jgi:DNA-binding response OmpR family regulator
MKKILIVEDDKALRETLTTALESENFEVLGVADGAEGYRIGSEEKVDLIVLDCVLPAMTGFDVCKKLRMEGNSTPIIFLTGEKKEEIDRIIGLEIGADDYLLKPFGTRELIARINAILRRVSSKSPEVEVLSFGDVTINFKKQVVLKGKSELSLTAKEIGLIKLLSKHEGEVVSRDKILNEVWGYKNYPTTRTVDTFIHKLRQKIEDDPSHPVHLITVPWSGYKFIK